MSSIQATVTFHDRQRHDPAFAIVSCSEPLGWRAGRGYSCALGRGDVAGMLAQKVEGVIGITDRTKYGFGVQLNDLHAKGTRREATLGGVRRAVEAALHSATPYALIRDADGRNWGYMFGGTSLLAQASEHAYVENVYANARRLSENGRNLLLSEEVWSEAKGREIIPMCVYPHAILFEGPGSLDSATWPEYDDLVGRAVAQSVGRREITVVWV